MFGGLGAVEVILIAFLLLLLFGARRIPQIARGIGEGIRNFKSGMQNAERLEDPEAPGPDEGDGRS